LGAGRDLDNGPLCGGKEVSTVAEAALAAFADGEGVNRPDVVHQNVHETKAIAKPGQQA
jgi:hypothetical protein